MRKNLFELLQIEVEEVGERGRAHFAVGEPLGYGQPHEVTAVDGPPPLYESAPPPPNRARAFFVS